MLLQTIVSCLLGSSKRIVSLFEFPHGFGVLDSCCHISRSAKLLKHIPIVCFCAQWEASAESTGKKVRVNTVTKASSVAAAKIRLFKVHPPFVHGNNEVIDDVVVEFSFFGRIVVLVCVILQFDAHFFEEAQAFGD